MGLQCSQRHSPANTDTRENRIKGNTLFAHNENQKLIQFFKSKVNKYL